MRLFRPEFVDRGGKKRRTPRWHAEFTDDTDHVRRVAAFRGKAESQELLTKLVRLVELKGTGNLPDSELVRWVDALPPRILRSLRRLGLVTTALDPQRYKTLVDTRAKKGEPKEDLLEDFGEALRQRGRDSRHVSMVTGNARRLFAACGFKKLAGR